MTHPLQQISFANPNQAFVIEASAGTGKTWTIERLYIKALLEANQVADTRLPISVENILVVTFTNDATDELKQRISEQIQKTIDILIYLLNNATAELPDDLFINYLQDRKQEFDLRKDITLLTRALQNFDSSAIFTIHGFCNRILQDYQFECSCPSMFELLPSKESLIMQLVRDFMRKMIFTNEELAAHLAVVEANLVGMFRTMDQDATLIELIAAKIPKDLFAINNNEYVQKYKFTQVGTLDGLTNPELGEEDKRIVKAEFLAMLIDYIEQNYALESEKINALSYDELIQKVADSVANSAELADKLYSKYPLSFIDEFQDTDSLQWQIFSQIYHLNSEKNNNRGIVVVVGDPKQAIYRFRGADVETYIEARAQIGNLLQLNQNFRSHPDIMNFINQLFSLQSQNVSVENSFLGTQIDYTHVEACGSSSNKLPTAAAIEQLLARAEINHQAFYDEPVQLVAITGVSVAERKVRLLQAMTFEILSLLNADSSLKGKIAIIVTKNREATEIVSFLRKYGVKAAELKLGNIFASNTAHDLYQILFACIDLGQRKNFLKALSCQLFNVSLAKLAVDGNGASSVLEVWYKRFFNYNQTWLKRGVISLVYLILEDITTEHGDLTAVLSNRELANLYQLAELLNKQSARVHNQSELMYWFKNKLENAENQLSGDLDGSNEELVRLDNDDEQIIITTQHKSKGLEYEVLFCPYFKSGVQLDGQYDYNYRRPFFSNYRRNNTAHAEMIMDKETGLQVVQNDNKEIHRLNYVALTRAKSRIYIYLKQPTISKSTGQYNSSQRPDKLAELFGYVADNPSDDTHRLFNYPQFFGQQPMAALKLSNNFSGVVAYQRNNLTPEHLQALNISTVRQNTAKTDYKHVADDFNLQVSFSRQSYSGITSHDNNNDALNDWFIKNEATPLEPVEYIYKILHDKEFKGATFGVLFHSLCEEYPFSDEQLLTVTRKYNLNLQGHEYLAELRDMVERAFNYPLMPNLTLNTMANKLHELEFNLQVTDRVELQNSLSKLLTKYLGDEHPFTLASRTLGEIEIGFLIGFIDLFFIHDGKYWILDYKTNNLKNYNSATIQTDDNNEIIRSMSDHHYYLQYLLYLVAIKRYLEQVMQIDDATDLIGGAVYFYVRGVFAKNISSGDGVFVDESCRFLVRDLDLLLRGL